MKACFFILPLLLAPGAVFACPELKNRDTQAHTYQLSCNGKTISNQIKAGETQKLTGRGKQGCILSLGSSSSFKLTPPTKCVIQDNTLKCK